MTQDERTTVIDQLNRSFLAMPVWAQIAVKHALGAPTINPDTGEPFKSFQEVLVAARDETLEVLVEDFKDNDDLLPPLNR